jgi:threonine aldolase
MTVADRNGKIGVDQIEPLLAGKGDQHRSQLRLVSITQATEYGTVYRPEEIREISRYTMANDMFLHMDGARLSNAAASLGCSLREITASCGVDVLSFGGTKNGLMMGEAVVFFNPELAKNFRYLRKQAMQLPSKMRFVAAQFVALLKDDLWLRNARHSNRMAADLGRRLGGLKNIQLSRPVEANAVFAIMPRAMIQSLQKDYFFYVWDESRLEVRLMTTFDTTEADVEGFAARAAELDAC